MALYTFFDSQGGLKSQDCLGVLKFWHKHWFNVQILICGVDKVTLTLKLNAHIDANNMDYLPIVKA